MSHIYIKKLCMEHNIDKWIHHNRHGKRYIPDVYTKYCINKIDKVGFENYIKEYESLHNSLHISTVLPYDTGIVLNASDVSKAAGYNKYFSQYSLINKNYRNIFCNINEKERKQLQTEIQNIFNEINEEDNKTNSEISTDVYLPIKTNTQVGICMERSDIKYIERYFNCKIYRPNKLYAKHFILPSGFSIEIRGRIDGIFENGTILETKHRIKKIFDEIPIEEQIQCETYMRLLNKKICVHIQNHNGIIKPTTLNMNDDIWEPVLYGLDEYVIMYLNFQLD